MPVDAPDLAARDTAKQKTVGWRFMEIDEAVVQDQSFIGPLIESLNLQEGSLQICRLRSLPTAHH